MTEHASCTAAAPAVHKRIEVDLALLDDDDQRLTDLALPSVHTAKAPAANTLDRLRARPGVGTILALVMLSAIHASQRFPRVQDGVSSCRLVTCATAAAGQRYGTSGQPIGQASLQWAFAEAAVLCLRNHEAGHTSLARLAKTHGTGKALTLRAHALARAVYDMLNRDVACAMAPCRHGARRGVGEPGVARDGEGRRLSPALCPRRFGVCARRAAQRPTIPEPDALLGHALPLLERR